MSLTSIKHGVYGGLAGGVVFGAMMGMMGMLPMIGNMAGVPSAWVDVLLDIILRCQPFQLPSTAALQEKSL